jgi:Tol biopolymer transport system component
MTSVLVTLLAAAMLAGYGREASGRIARIADPIAETGATREILSGPATGKVSAFPGGDGLIAFRGSKPGVRHSFAIYAVKPDGTGRRRLSGYGAWYNPAWSPDGRRLIVEHILQGGPANDDSIYVLSPGRRPRKVVKWGSNGDWSPNGRRIVFECPPPSGGLCLVDVTGRRRHVLTHAVDYSPAWSPQGQRIAFCRNPPNGNTTLYTINRDGSHARRIARLSDTASSGFAPSWSPDGKKIAIVNQGIDFRRVDVMDADGSNRKTVSIGRGLTPISVIWSPDGRSLAFLEGFEARWLYTIRADGQAVTKIARANGSRLSWQPLHG